ncbi:hypothetical protein SCLCIDRAFT_1225350, partial [Scleroderma citrinum Foug A]
MQSSYLAFFSVSRKLHTTLALYSYSLDGTSVTSSVYEWRISVWGSISAHFWAHSLHLEYLLQWMEDSVIQAGG